MGEWCGMEMEEKNGSKSWEDPNLDCSGHKNVPKIRKIAKTTE